MAGPTVSLGGGPEPKAKSVLRQKGMRRVLRALAPAFLGILLVVSSIASLPLPFVKATTLTSIFGTPVIDGSIGFGEWSNPSQVTFPHGFITVMNDGIRLYVLLDVTGDNVNDPPLTSSPWGDYFWLTFDVNRDSKITQNVDLNYGAVPGTYNLRYQYYLNASTWTGLVSGPIRSSLAAGFGCFFGDGSLSISFTGTPPFINVNCSAHRVWELGIDLVEIGATPGGSVRMGVRAYSQNPSFTDEIPNNFENDFSNLLLVNLAGSLPAADPKATFAFEQNPVEVTQAIQTRTNSLPLVQGKTTVARAYVDTVGATGPQPAVVYLYGTNGGNDLPGSPLALLQMAPNTPNRATLTDTANFLLPGSWTSGTVQFQGTVRTISGSQQQSTATFSLAFTARTVPTIWVIPVNQGTAGTPTLISQATINSQESYFKAIYPVSDATFVQKPWNVLPVNPPDVIAALNNYFGLAVLAWILTGGTAFTLPRQVYGFTTAGGGLSDPTWAGGAGWVARGFLGTSLEGTMAHEINHNLDRSATGTWGRHVSNPACASTLYTGGAVPAGCVTFTGSDGRTYLRDNAWGCGASGPDPSWPAPPNNDNLREVGLDTRTMTIVPGTFPDVMSYCQSGALPTKWISPYRWQNLFGILPMFNTIFSVQAIDPTVYYMTGNLNRNGTGHLNPIYVEPGIPTPDIASGPYSIQLRDSGGTLLSSTSFGATFTDVEGDPRATASFSFQIPANAGTGRIQLRNGTTLLDEIVVSAGVPTVSVVSPGSGAHWVSGPQTIQWSASDPDGDPLHFTLLYTPDNGINWIPIANNLAGTSYTVDSSAIQGGSQSKIRVIATDGFNTAQSDSALFTVDDKPPTVTLSSPAAGSKLNHGASISFQADAVDLEDTHIPDSSFVWKYDNTDFGTGRNLQAVLPDGVHQVTVSVVDSAGKMTIQSMTVTVGSVATPVFSSNQGLLFAALLVAVLAATFVSLRGANRRRNLATRTQPEY